MNTLPREDDGSSLRSWLIGDKRKSMELLEQTTHNGWREQCRQKHNQNVLMRHIRIIEKPSTPYTEWELESYKAINIPGGDRSS